MISGTSGHRVIEPLVKKMKVVERVLEKGLRGIATVNEMQFCFMPERGIIDTVFIFRMLQKEYQREGWNGQ